MATVHGTAGNDFIHAGGEAPPSGSYNDEPYATAGNDTIDSGGGGTDTIDASYGDDTITFGSDLDPTDFVNGGNGSDTLIIDDPVDITFGAGSLESIEKILLPSFPVQQGFAASQSLTMNDANTGKSWHVIGPNHGLTA
jgi:Ca2+-binding RTX toxin-like protein